MGEDKTARRCKLSVIIIEDENMMFVNYKGALVAEKSFEEFNDEIANDKSKMIMGHSAFDHAFKAVIDRLD
jgi:predicted transcriptional regulator